MTAPASTDQHTREWRNLMQKQHENNEWNERWLRQIAAWNAELLELLEEAETLMALIDLAKSQIKQEPPA
jgi:hypothetical protein